MRQEVECPEKCYGLDGSGHTREATTELLLTTGTSHHRRDQTG